MDGAACLSETTWSQLLYVCIFFILLLPFVRILRPKPCKALAEIRTMRCSWQGYIFLTQWSGHTSSSMHPFQLHAVSRDTRVWRSMGWWSGGSVYAASGRLCLDGTLRWCNCFRITQAPVSKLSLMLLYVNQQSNKQTKQKKSLVHQDALG